MPSISTTLQAIRGRNPLVHNITNYVVMNNTANALLAIGASPVMAHAIEEVEAIVDIASALVINMGTLSPPWVEAMKRAATRANARGLKWVFDPVGVGASPYRNQVAADLFALKPTVLRANAGEVAALAGAAGGGTRGVDSTTDSGHVAEAAVQLAQRSGSIIAMTGAVDYVTDGSRVVAVANGHPLLARVTGTGCTASALVGAAIAVTDDAATGAAHALAFLGLAGEQAAATAAGPGSMQAGLLDALYRLDEGLVDRQARVKTL